MCPHLLPTETLQQFVCPAPHLCLGKSKSFLCAQSQNPQGCLSARPSRPAPAGGGSGTYSPATAAPPERPPRQDSHRRVHPSTRTGVHSVETKPFRPPTGCWSPLCHTLAEWPGNAKCPGGSFQPWTALTEGHLARVGVTSVCSSLVPPPITTFCLNQVFHILRL